MRKLRTNCSEKNFDTGVNKSAAVLAGYIDWSWLLLIMLQYEAQCSEKLTFTRLSSNGKNTLERENLAMTDFLTYRGNSECVESAELPTVSAC